MNDKKGWVLIIGVLLILAVMVFGVLWGFKNAVDRAIRPMESITGDLGTRVYSVLNPTPTIIPNPVTIVHDVRSLARLETIQYTLEKVITAETNQGVFGVLFGDKLLFIAHGYVIAGVDLGKLSPEDLELKNGVLYLQLPEPEIFVATLDNEKSFVYDRQTGLFTKGNLNLESEARRVAENEIEKAALEDGILELARQNAESFLYRLMIQLGYLDVVFISDSSTPQP